MKADTKLTSVNILDDVYKKFKIKSIEGSMNLQKLVHSVISSLSRRKIIKHPI